MVGDMGIERVVATLRVQGAVVSHSKIITFYATFPRECG
jgi:hypothetical protein